MGPLARTGSLACLLGLVACGQAETSRLGGQGLTPNGCYFENGEVALHWAPGDRCLGVSYDPALEAYAETIDVALAAWADLECSGLCFEAPRPMRLAPDEHPEGRLHLAPSTAAEGEQIVQSVLRSRTDSLELVSAIGYLDAEVLDGFDAERRAGAITGAIGHLLGLPHAPSGASSVLTRNLADLAPAPTEADAATFCKVYGEGGVCAL